MELSGADDVVSDWSYGKWAVVTGATDGIGTFSPSLPLLFFSIATINI